MLYKHTNLKFLRLTWAPDNDPVDEVVKKDWVLLWTANLSGATAVVFWSIVEELQGVVCFNVNTLLLLFVEGNKFFVVLIVGDCKFVVELWIFFIITLDAVVLMVGEAVVKVTGSVLIVPAI